MTNEFLEQQFLESDEFRDALEIWERDDASEFQPFSESAVSVFVRTSRYAELLRAYVANWDPSHDNEENFGIFQN